jgi:hypothetical protein
MELPMVIKALTFDIPGTVFDWLGSFTQGVPPLAHQYGLNLNPGASPTLPQLDTRTE